MSCRAAASSTDPMAGRHHPARFVAMSEPVNITMIAKRVGVSPGTVSRVLNGLNKENRPAIARRAERIHECRGP